MTATFSPVSAPGGKTILQHLRALSFRKARTRSGRNKEASPTPKSDARGTRRKRSDTALNALKLILQMLSSAASNIPVAAMFSSIIDSILDITDRFEQSSTNGRDILELKQRIQHLRPIVSDMNSAPKESQVVEALKCELQSITRDMEEANSQGRLEQFFNSTANASALAKHNAALTQIISDSTFFTVQEIQKTLQDLQRSNLPPGSFATINPQGEIEICDIAGGWGGTGGHARIGGQGGDGEGPQLEISPDERWEIGNISGGIGGIGGTGIDVGGKGGTGKAPQIRISRRNPGYA